MSYWLLLYCKNFNPTLNIVPSYDENGHLKNENDHFDIEIDFLDHRMVVWTIEMDLSVTQMVICIREMGFSNHKNGYFYQRNDSFVPNK